jgi:hypothetical protein
MALLSLDGPLPTFPFAKYSVDGNHCYVLAVTQGSVCFDGFWDEHGDQYTSFLDGKCPPQFNLVEAQGSAGVFKNCLAIEIGASVGVSMLVHVCLPRAIWRRCSVRRIDFDAGAWDFLVMQPVTVMRHVPCATCMNVVV